MDRNGSEAENLDSTIEEQTSIPSKRQIKLPTHLKNYHLYCAINEDEPITYEDAIKDKNSKNWIKAMNEEMETLYKNNTWDLVNLPDNKSTIDNRWIYKTKHDENGKLYKYRARLVVRGFTQRYGVNYFETFSPVVKYDSVRLIIALAAIYNMNIKQFDVKTAFCMVILKKKSTWINQKDFRITQKEFAG